MLKRDTLTPDDYKIFRAVIKITAYIDGLYNQLYKLEIGNKKETLEYKKCIDNLSNAILKEKELYEKIDNSLVYILNDYILKNMIKDDLESDFESFMLHDYQNRIVRRILFTLDGKIVPLIEEKEDSNSLFQLVSLVCQTKSKQKTFEAIVGIKKLDKSLETDLLNTFLSFLEEHMEEQSSKIKKEAIKIKYNVSFVNKDVEANLIEEQFNIPSDLFLNSKWNAQVLNLEANVYDLAKDIYASVIAQNQIYQLLRITDTEYKEFDQQITIIFRHCFMEAALIFMSREKVREEFDNFVKSKHYRAKYKDNGKSVGLIEQVFSKIEDKRSKPKVISLAIKQKEK